MLLVSQDNLTVYLENFIFDSEKVKHVLSLMRYQQTATVMYPYVLIIVTAVFHQIKSKLKKK